MKVNLKNATYVYEGEDGAFVYFLDVESGIPVESVNIPEGWWKIRTSDGTYHINPDKVAFTDYDEENQAVVIAFESVVIDEEEEEIANALVFAREEDEEGFKRALEVV